MARPFALQNAGRLSGALRGGSQRGKNTQKEKWFSRENVPGRKNIEIKVGMYGYLK